MSVPVSEWRIAVHSFAVCVNDVKEWMRAMQTAAKPDQDAGHVARLHPAGESHGINNIPLSSTTVQVVESTCDLGVILDNRLTLSAHDTHVVALCRAGYYTSSDNYARSSNRWRWKLQDKEHYSHRQSAAFICSRLHYCNSLLCCLPDTLLRKLQSVQNATSWSYHAGTTRTPLAAHPRARQVQSDMPGSPVAVRVGASILGRRLLPRVRLQSALSVVSWRSDLHGTNR